MERVRDLIHKLSAQEAAQEAPAALLATVRILVAELEALLPRPVLPQSGRVAVLMPAPPAHPPGPLPDRKEETHPPAPSQRKGEENVTAVKPESLPEPVFVPEKPIVDEPKAFEEPQRPMPDSQPQTYSLRPPAFDPIEEVPTLAQQTPPPAEPKKEVFEAHTPGESLNDRLKRGERELAHKLVDTPIKDLRKGIGINDRYLFISELFRGDEAMYERSIKTINSFHILPEAEYWINRELKVKLGWPDTATVRLFDQLVRRRFS